MKIFRVNILLIFLVLIAFFSVQFIWLYSFHRIYMQDMAKSSSTIFREVLSDEIYIRLENNPEARQYASFRGEDSVKQFPVEYYLDALVRNGNDVDMEVLDSLFRVKLEAEKIPFKEISYNILDSIPDDAGNGKVRRSRLYTRPLAIRNSIDRYIQAVVSVNGNQPVYALHFPLVASALTLLLIVACIVYQMRIIATQRNLARIRDEFTYAMIHDMKTPIGTISMAGNALKDGLLDSNPELKSHYFKIINEEAEHLMTLSNKILTVAKLEYGHEGMVFVPVDLEKIIRETVETFKIRSGKKAVFEMSFNHSSVLNADPQYLKEAISNLVDNAIKYSGDTVVIRISTDESDNHISISVRDNGIGIPLKEKERIFERFQRGKSSSGDRNGYGLGLNFVLNVVTMMNGYINVKSSEGEYSEFTIVIPVIPFNAD